MENRYNYICSQGSISRWKNSEEFQEADVWGAVGATDNSDSRIVSTTTFLHKRLPAASRMIPKSDNKNSTTFQEPKNVLQTAPVHIPDWSKIYRSSNPKESCPWLDADADYGGGGDRLGVAARSSWESEDEDDEDGEGNVIPPHEWIAGKLARRRIASFSVCEGAGRTLKGRDLSRVRNNVLTKTGFLESNSNF